MADQKTEISKMIQDTIEDFDTKLGTLEEKVTSLEQKVSDCQADISVIQQETKMVYKINQKVQELEEGVKVGKEAAQSDIGRIEEGFRKELTDKDQQIDELKKTIKSLKNQFAEVESAFR
eukprot:CAMPEP_0115023128 /NCGR_PEP_ID=MMETSP0216-20121206/32143_1 /TAXON_ID=223996 /ORGANISM="Protocruzia adherens, Strain Boccale" /LENGTH=119 /DNA_ID=CAMNT_0002396307 /DNA_START=217 /DNA_END=576 /DNA_ORIENTATION=-